MLHDFSFLEKMNLYTGVVMSVITFVSALFILLKFFYSELPNTNWMFFSFIILLYSIYRSYKVYFYYRKVKEKKLYGDENESI
jgi:hypothetical protein